MLSTKRYCVTRERARMPQECCGIQKKMEMEKKWEKIGDSIEISRLADKVIESISIFLFDFWNHCNSNIYISHQKGIWEQ